MLDDIYRTTALVCVILAVCAYISALKQSWRIAYACRCLLISGLSAVGTLLSTCNQRIFWIHSIPSCMIGLLLL
ncbi:hypothetical protein BDB00DRAFT_863593 [Zychaea mexicana]|uniref:uncharacterized protein n=1 Tax=Zychaea mexicana TaxID=64656 RepID=UPI0022FE76D7|nr:uncharacterized protein BDB00DRAFT_863593 [Zychaea mexicana]KAI9468674.1 hypothetical protein BDB00DRAFT_863593 [Zychaea mexicana]